MEKDNDGKIGREAVNFLRVCNWSAVVDKCNNFRKESFVEMSTVFDDLCNWNNSNGPFMDHYSLK